MIGGLAWIPDLLFANLPNENAPTCRMKTRQLADLSSKGTVFDAPLAFCAATSAGHRRFEPLFIRLGFSAIAVYCIARFRVTKVELISPQ